MTEQHHQGGEGVPPPSQSPATQPGDPGADALPPDPAPGNLSITPPEEDMDFSPELHAEWMKQTAKMIIDATLAEGLGKKRR